MRKVALAFFTVAPLYGVVGMAWGAQMGMSGDHLMHPAHAHLNLLGLVLGGIMGAFYALAGEGVSNRLAWVNFWLSNLGVIIMTPVLAIILAGNEAPPLLIAITLSEVLLIGGLIVFWINVLKLWKRPAA